MSRFRFIIALSLFIIFTTLSVNAVESYVQRKYIDSNTWTDITTAYKTNQGGYAEVKILEMYKADGSTSNYSRLNVRIGKAGEQASQRVAYKGQWIAYPLNSDYIYSGTLLRFYGMGYDPALDCQITGYFNAH